MRGEYGNMAARGGILQLQVFPEKVLDSNGLVKGKTGLHVRPAANDDSLLQRDVAVVDRSPDKLIRIMRDHPKMVSCPVSNIGRERQFDMAGRAA